MKNTEQVTGRGGLSTIHGHCLGCTLVTGRIRMNGGFKEDVMPFVTEEKSPKMQRSGQILLRITGTRPN